MLLSMPMPKRVDVDDYPAQLPQAAIPHLTKLRGLSLAVAPGTGPGW
jgi:hypothetical protein